MICDQLSVLTGFNCVPLDETLRLAMLTTPFTFADGEPLPVFVEHMGHTVRFFDDGRVLLHFRGRGLSLKNKQQARFIAQAAERHGARLGDDWVLEANANHTRAADAFRCYMTTLQAICDWELENEGTAEDIVLTLERVVMALQAVKPNADIQRYPTFEGISGKTRKLDLLVDGTGLAITNTQPASVSAALMTVVDIRQSPENQGKDFQFIINDYANPEKAQRDALVLQAAAPVQLLSNLERQAYPTPPVLQ